MAYLTLSALQKSYGANHVVKSFDLDVAQGEFVSLLGPSGCGKTTVLRMVAGFEVPSAGQLHIGGQDVTGLRPNQRNIGMVFQAYALFPNMTVAQNVGFGLKIAGKSARDIALRVQEMLDLIGLSDMGPRYPFQLSGGQQQRVALARALAPAPSVLLLDEPLSALDAKIRVSLRNEIRDIQRKLGITTIFVTHDQEEALSMSDRVVVMNGGRAEQVGTPFEVYNQPKTRFVAEFVGTLNTLEAKVEDAGLGRVVVQGQVVNLGRPLRASTGAVVTLALRPETVHLVADKGDVALAAEISELQFLGSVIRVKAQSAGGVIKVDLFNRPNTLPPALGQNLMLWFRAEDLIELT
jgi:putative spermidine/putrescine transport system ATP-binding protein